MSDNGKFLEEYITLSDFYVAYRKAKFDSFYDKLHPSAISFSDYERELSKNLESLYDKIVIMRQEWWKDETILGGFSYIPKSLDDANWNDPDKVHYRLTDPDSDWMNRYRDSGNDKLTANYRLIIKPSVEYQIISALWIMKVGHKYDAVLDTKLSYGNRLRRNPPSHDEIEVVGSINRNAMGLFLPYFTAYRAWRKNGLNAMKNLINSGFDVTAVTMDLASFYHNVSPDFLTEEKFLKKIGVSLSHDDFKFTNNLVSSINNWYEKTPDFKIRNSGAIPVGLSASKIISNVLLYELDDTVFKKLNPEYYGRYVDDIFIVFKSPRKSQNGNDVINYMVSKIKCLEINSQKNKNLELRINFPYAEKCDLKFTKKKQKIFILSKQHGLDLISQIENQIKNQSSEYRLLPDVPSSSVDMANKTLLASSDSSLIADALRKADVVSIRRLGLSLLIRDIESYSLDLSSDSWKNVRAEFYSLVERYLITPKGIFDFFSYLPRIYGVLVSNQDFELARMFIRRLKKILNIIYDTTFVENNSELIFQSCREYFAHSLYEKTLKTLSSKRFYKSNSSKQTQEIIRLINSISSASFPSKIAEVDEISNQILLSDFGEMPYKEYWYYHQNVDVDNIERPDDKKVKIAIRLESIDKFRKGTTLNNPHWPALAFATRPLSLQEIYLFCPKVLDDKFLLTRSILALRGARTFGEENIGRNADENHGWIISVPNKNVSKSIFVALTNFEMTTEDFENSIKGVPNRTKSRYEKINKIINDILKVNQKIHYVVFPECAIPRRWAFNIAKKLSAQGISMISGIEYYNSAKDQKIMRNDCMISLSKKWPGYQTNLVFLQPKISPSHGEKKKLEENNLSLYPVLDDKEKLPIFKHGPFYFGALICSDLTNPMNRVRFQGRVDGVFVLEWNQDVKTFGSLIESSAHDIHAFIIQVNNRAFGDSRIRAPFRLDYQRDTVRIKGGITDHFVIAEIQFSALREFQETNIMTDEKSIFKPVPIGFDMACYRKKIIHNK